MVSADNDDPIDVDDYLTRFPEFMECREDGHAWRKEQKAWRQVGSGRAATFEKTVACMRCPTRRTKVLDASFRRTHLRYDYPDGYKAPGLHLRRADIEQWDIEQFTLSRNGDSNGAHGQRASPPRRKPRRQT